MYALFTTIILIVLELIYFRIADRYNIIDKPNHRSSHSSITIRGGGIIFYFGLILFFFTHGWSYPYFFLGATLVTVVSFIDDIRPLSSRIRLLLQFIGMGLLLYSSGIGAYPWYFWIIALIFITGTINAYNFMDGINGITGAYSLVVIGGLWYANNYIMDFTSNSLIYTVLISLLIFNFFNFRKRAKCFAGDVGSVTIAFIICFLMAQLILTTDNFSYLSLLLVYGIDASYTLLHRFLRKEKLTEAHRSHTYQIMANELRIPHLVVSSVYALLQGVIIIGFYYFYKEGTVFFWITAGILSCLYWIFRKKFYHLHHID